MFLTGTDEG
jgi:hypothetical protein